MQLLFRAITKLEVKFAKQEVLPRLMDRLAQATAGPVLYAPDARRLGRRSK